MDTRARWIIFCLLGALILFPGCNPGHFSVTFKEIQGLKVKDGVLFRTTRVGEVTKITYTDAGEFRVRLEIPEEFRHTATQASRFHIGTTADGGRAVIITQTRPGAPPLENGSIVKGSDPLSGLAASLVDQVRERIQDIGSSILSDMDPEKEGTDTLKTQIQGMAARAKALFKEEVLPFLEKQLDALDQWVKSLDKKTPQES